MFHVVETVLVSNSCAQTNYFIPQLIASNMWIFGHARITRCALCLNYVTICIQ